VMKSGLPEMIKVAKMLAKHLEGAYPILCV